MPEYTEEINAFYEIEPNGAISTKIQTKVFQDGKLISTSNHRGVADVDTAEHEAKLAELVTELPVAQNKTIEVFKKDIADLKHEKDSLCEDLVTKDQLIEKMTMSLEAKDAKIAVLEDELNNLTE